MNIVVDKLLTNYKLSGEGRLVLLLHGWGDSARGLSKLQKDLEAGGHQVLALDLPGFGGTQAPESAWDLDDYSRFIAAVLKKLGLKQPYAVIGHSNGGALAIRAISMELLRPQKLVLLAAAGVRTNSTGKRLFLKIIAKTGNAATIWMPERYRKGLRKSLYGAAGSDMLVMPRLEDTFKKTVRQDVQADAVAIDASTLLIYAAEDDAIPVADGKQYHDLIKDSRLEIIEGAGHFVHTDQPEKVTKLIREFLR
ncbi:MAG TPA: alpha/beta hydrolase [Candidatus Saccharimonadales bacterium]|nr:alpha/beta hydrolase [Candidatus Saccharimonadales bacterium]